ILRYPRRKAPVRGAPSPATGMPPAMTIRFAAPASTRASRMSPRTIREFPAAPANDNGGDGTDDAMLDAALRHFARHGLAAAQRARKQAEAAFFANDRQAYRWWLEICRMLDRRMAGELVAEPGRAG